jgi:hypothetical protein
VLWQIPLSQRQTFLFYSHRVHVCTAGNPILFVHHSAQHLFPVPAIKFAQLQIKTNVGQKTTPTCEDLAARENVGTSGLAAMSTDGQPPPPPSMAPPAQKPGGALAPPPPPPPVDTKSNGILHHGSHVRLHLPSMRCLEFSIAASASTAAPPTPSQRWGRGVANCCDLDSTILL